MFYIFREQRRAWLRLSLVCVVTVVNAHIRAFLFDALPITILRFIVHVADRHTIVLFICIAFIYLVYFNVYANNEANRISTEVLHPS